MKPSEIRNELLEQHQGLRLRIEQAREVVTRCQRGEDARDDLHRALVHVADAVRMHNQREEELMHDVLPPLDVWGHVRKEVMLEEHVVEHSEIFNALMQASSGKDLEKAAATALTLFEQMLQHMEREEKVFLGADLLSDFGAPPDTFGG